MVCAWTGRIPHAVSRTATAMRRRIRPILEARPERRRRIFGAHAADLRAQLLRCSLTQLSNALAPLLGAFLWGPRDAVAGGAPGSPNLSAEVSGRASRRVWRCSPALAPALGRRQAAPS